MIKHAQDKITVGAGTVLNLQDFEKAVTAGARFIVCPSIVEDVIQACKNENIPVFPGALTPSEVHRAWEMGATMVKLFPSSVFGPGYIKELKGPFNNIKIMAVGGINEKNVSEYFASGADAVAFGGSIFNLKWMEDKRFDLIENKIHDLINNYKMKGL
jgi:2-dehydro-3-deoxyphosphogluconate aldolase/(4S)-4-hydroxy-2-oxoglutarate aldolase